MTLVDTVLKESCLVHQQAAIADLSRVGAHLQYAVSRKHTALVLVLHELLADVVVAHEVLPAFEPLEAEHVVLVVVGIPLGPVEVVG